MFKTRYLAEVFAKKIGLINYMIKKNDDYYTIYIPYLPTKEDLNKAYGAKEVSGLL